MLKNNSDGFKINQSRQKIRPRSSITKRSIDIYAEVVPLHRRIKHAYHISSITDINRDTKSFVRTATIYQNKIDSDKPQTVYNWLDQFEQNIVKKAVGTSFQYPITKYQQSVRLVDSKGYKNVKAMQRLQKLPNFVKIMREDLRKIHEKF